MIPTTVWLELTTLDGARLRLIDVAFAAVCLGISDFRTSVSGFHAIFTERYGSIRIRLLVSSCESVEDGAEKLRRIFRGRFRVAWSEEI